jgi:hypothetical protein
LPMRVSRWPGLPAGTVEHARRTAMESLHTPGAGSDVSVAELFDDEELCRLALAAPARTQPAPDAVPMAVALGTDDGLLPDWYMPAPVTGRVRRPRWQRWVVFAVIGGLVGIEAAGLCNTFGPLIPH